MAKERPDCWVGFDLGGTKMLATVLDAEFNQVGSKRRRTKGHEGVDAGLDRIKLTIAEALEEAGVVLAVFTDSDSSGGGTGYDGHRFQVKYQLSNALQLAGSFFLNGDDASRGGGDYRRSQVDLIAKF